MRSRVVWNAAVVAAGLALSLGLNAAADEIDDLKAAAGRGEAAALFELGDRYERGDALPHDLTRSAAYMRLAAERGHGPAQYRLGLAYASGLGVAPDLPESYAWLSLAAVGSGDAALMAAALREPVSKQVSAADADRMDKRVAAFSPSSGAAELPEAADEGKAANLTVETLLAALPPTTCGTMAVTTEEGGKFAVAGYVARGKTADVLAPEVAGFLSKNSVDIRLTELEPPLCPVLEVITRAVEDAADELPLILRDEHGAEKEVFRDGEHLVIDMRGLPDDRLITVDYFQHDGKVLHLAPGGGPRQLLLRAQQRLVLGDPAGGGGGWRVGPPFGQDMLVIFASRAPLFEAARPQVEHTADYLTALKPRMAAAQGDADIRLRYRILTTAAE